MKTRSPQFCDAARMHTVNKPSTVRNMLEKEVEKITQNISQNTRHCHMGQHL